MSDFTKLKAKKNGKEYILNVCTQDTEQNIIGTKNFSKLTVNGKNIVRSVNGVDADASGNVTITADSTVSLKGTRTTTGTWTITGLTPYKPLYFILDEEVTSGSAYLSLTNLVGCTTKIGYLDLGQTNQGIDCYCHVAIPTRNTVSVNIDKKPEEATLYAYQ